MSDSEYINPGDLSSAEVEEIFPTTATDRQSVWSDSAKTEVTSVNAYIFNQLQKVHHRLVGATDLSQLIELLLVELPSGLGFAAAELQLYDPEGVFVSLLPVGNRFSDSLAVTSDAFELQELYDRRPTTEFLDATDTRMFQILKMVPDVDGALIMPLMDGGRLIGSYHCGLSGQEPLEGAVERSLFEGLASSISRAMRAAVRIQQADKLTLLDPVTEIGNLRCFRRDLQREISWSRRGEQSLSVLLMEIDELEEIEESYGESAAHFVLKRVSQRICSDLRATDYISRLSDRKFGILLPACSEPHAHDIGERMRRDIDDFAVDDGRGAVLYVTLSVGMVTWDPKTYPMKIDAQLSSQLETEADEALARALRSGGNRVGISRLTPLMV